MKFVHKRLDEEDAENLPILLAYIAAASSGKHLIANHESGSFELSADSKVPAFDNRATYFRFYRPESAPRSTWHISGGTNETEDTWGGVFGKKGKLVRESDTWGQRWAIRIIKPPTENKAPYYVIVPEITKLVPKPYVWTVSAQGEITLELLKYEDEADHTTYDQNQLFLIKQTEHPDDIDSTFGFLEGR